MVKQNIRTRAQTLGEEIANAVSHGTGAALAIAGTVLLIIKACFTGEALSVVSVTLYGVSLIVLYTFSTLYHSVTNEIGKKVLRVFDHCSIFFLILGSYIPITLCLIQGALGWTLFGVNVFCAAIGITVNAINLDRWKKFSMLLYIVMGWSIVMSIKPVVLQLAPQGLMLLAGGGIFYTLGIIFYKNKRTKYMHFVWHLFVLVGSVLHFFCIFNYIL